jgi:hypothetical protein
MFTLDPQRAFVQVAPAQIAALYHSVNTTSVLVPGQPQARARAVVCGSKTDAGFEVVIALHLIDSGRHLVYTSDSGPLDAEGAREAAKEAIQFAESMGFFVETLSWRHLDPVAQSELVAELKVFQPPPEQPVEQAARKVVDPRTRLARVLAQF